MNLEECLRRFISIQRALLSRISSHIDLDDQHFNNLRPGELFLEGESWRYHGHGAGLTFECGRNTINVHVMPRLVEAVDSWRLSIYLDAQDIRLVEYSGEPQEVDDEAKVSNLLERMTQEGKLIRILESGTTQQLYRLR